MGIFTARYGSSDSTTAEPNLNYHKNLHGYTLIHILSNPNLILINIEQRVVGQDLLIRGPSMATNGEAQSLGTEKAVDTHHLDSGDDSGLPAAKRVKVDNEQSQNGNASTTEAPPRTKGTAPIKPE